jgi:hypothetical protein
MGQPVTPVQTATDAALPGNHDKGERRSRTRPDTSTILRSLIDEVITRSDTVEPVPHTGASDESVPPSTEPPGDTSNVRSQAAQTSSSYPDAPPAPPPVELPPLLPDRPMIPLTARADYTDPITASNRALGDDDGGAEAAIRGSVLLVILVGVTVVSAIITYLTLRP